ncbi:hypothetical protein [Hymenobacter perfusus]|uniref:Uncharacterized protein n=1 Tax=Hymenobacter perfusus TaxID=1236770 RepID=A0A428KCY1_9BACT|nr:hypothetical protein [Hymenobacter perfusus]RSK44283.1 hypothetical protein EI293_07015 [Hymenobacter perfusus]
MASISSRSYDGKVKYLFSPAARIAGYVLVGFGMLAFLQTMYGFATDGVTFIQLLSGPACLLVGYIMLSSYEGITLDAQTRRYRTYNWLLGFRQGEWVHLPAIMRVSVAPFNAVYTLHDSIAPSMKVQQHGLYRVLLSVENSRIGIIAAIDKQEFTLQKAAELSKLFDVEMTSTLGG